MRTFLLLAVFCVMGVAMWLNNSVKSLTQERDSLKEKLSLLTQELDSANAKPVRKLTLKPVNAPRVICPVCNGEKTVVFDPPGSQNPLARKIQTCPVCLGNGYRPLTVPKGMKICPDCKGMGLVCSHNQQRNPITAGNCVRCSSTGLVADVAGQLK